MPLVNGGLSAFIGTQRIGAHHRCYLGHHKFPSYMGQFLIAYELSSFSLPLIQVGGYQGSQCFSRRSLAVCRQAPNLAMDPARSLLQFLTLHNSKSWEIIEFGLIGYSWGLVRHHKKFCINDRCCNLGNATLKDCSLSHLLVSKIFLERGPSYCPPLALTTLGFLSRA